jgi:hypothetical protein
MAEPPSRFLPTPSQPTADPSAGPTPTFHSGDSAFGSLVLVPDAPALVQWPLWFCQTIWPPLLDPGPSFHESASPWKPVQNLQRAYLCILIQGISQLQMNQAAARDSAKQRAYRQFSSGCIQNLPPYTASVCLASELGQTVAAWPNTDQHRAKCSYQTLKRTAKILQPHTGHALPSVTGRHLCYAFCRNNLFAVATYTLVASIISETHRLDAPICFRIPASHSYAAALSGHTMTSSCMFSNSCARTPHLNSLSPM